MNINDVSADNVPADLPFIEYARMLFEKQRCLMMKYEVIEARNGATIPHPNVAGYYDVHHITTQLRLKDFFWRATEELTEALEFVGPGNRVQVQDFWTKPLAELSQDHIHVLEELADTFHFLVEACIYANLTPSDVAIAFSEVERNYEVAFDEHVGHELMNSDARLSAYEVIQQLGLAANTLKNKPWKQTQMMTDLAKFNGYMLNALGAFLWLFSVIFRATPYDMYQLYHKKSAVNKFRQETKY